MPFTAKPAQGFILNKKSIVLHKLMEHIVMLVRSGSKAEHNDYVKDAANSFNALSLPSMFIGIDGDNLVHITVISSTQNLSKSMFNVSLSIEHMADIVWTLDPITNEYTVHKDRTGTFRGRKWSGERVKGLDEVV